MLNQQHYKKVTFLGINTSNLELKDLGKAWLVISVAFAIAFSGLNVTNGFITMLIISAFTVGIGFLFHELGHKLTAQKFGCHSEFRANNTMLIVTLLVSLFGLVIAAPGAVFISTPNIGRVRNGKISAAGPGVNLVLAIIFLGLYLVSGTYFPGLQLFARYGFLINALLGVFNLIPIMGFDGSKIIKWSKPVYYTMLGVGIFLFIIQGVI